MKPHPVHQDMEMVKITLHLLNWLPNDKEIDLDLFGIALREDGTEASRYFTQNLAPDSVDSVVWALLSPDVATRCRSLLETLLKGLGLHLSLEISSSDGFPRTQTVAVVAHDDSGRKEFRVPFSTGIVLARMLDLDMFLEKDLFHSYGVSGELLDHLKST